MTANRDPKTLLKALPGVDHVLLKVKSIRSLESVPYTLLVTAIRNVIDALRTDILESKTPFQSEDLSLDHILRQVEESVVRALAPKLRRVINATGVVVHTNLGRSLLAEAALTNLKTAASHYSNLEYDLSTGKRGSRYSLVEAILCELTGAEAAMVVNNNAAAVLLCLNTIAQGKEAIVSRGELVEIGGSFRIPDVMAKSGALLKEVGTTNRTHAHDYESALTENTGLLLKVHTSNYSIVGFTTSVPLSELVQIGARHHIPVMEDLGSGTLIDFSTYGLIREPCVQDSVASGADIITFSGDKLLGGPQAGIILGKKQIVDDIKKNPLTRALRIDKLTLAALESTLQLYRDEEHAVKNIPTLQMIMMPTTIIEEKAQCLARLLTGLGDDRLHVQTLNRNSKTGGGALPLLELPSRCVAIRIEGFSTNKLEKAMRHYCPPIIGRIESDLFLLDLRTMLPDDIEMVKMAICNILNQKASGKKS